MKETHHKSIQTISMITIACVGLISLYIAYDNSRDRKIKKDIEELDRQIKELQLLKLKKTV